MADSVHGFSFTTQRFRIWLRDRTLLLLSAGTVAGAVGIIVQQARGLGVLRAREIVNEHAGPGRGIQHCIPRRPSSAEPRRGRRSRFPWNVERVTAEI